MKKLLLFICCMALVSFVNCNKDTYTLTVYISSTVGTNYTAYAKLVSEGGSENTAPEYSGSSALISPGVATITIDDIEDNTYTLYTFLDNNTTGQADPANPVAESGDYESNFYYGASITMDDDAVITASNWTGPL
ncbi:MAG: hypothetical protein V1874_04965 [Spirochaetota bacterium]